MAGRPKLQPVTDDDGELVIPLTIVQKNSATVAGQHRVISFRNRPMIEVYEPYTHFMPLTKERFDRLAYPLLGGVTRSRMSDVFSYLANSAEDLSLNDHLILFGRTEVDGEGKPMIHEDAVTLVWDTRDLERSSEMPAKCVWRSPYAPIPSSIKGVAADDNGRVRFVMDLAGGDPQLYDDIFQSIAPIIMDKKPDGAIWWIGDGANGKSTLMDAIYKIFPGALASLTVKALSDGRDTPSLNGTLANVVKESSEGRIDDTETYKAIGTHEDFTVHKFHSQESITVKGNLHHIFSGNSVPVFNDKGFSARRRTFIIPFDQRFESNPNFEGDTFTPEMFGRMVAEMQRYANKLKRQGYRYKFSAKTLGVKADYDAEVNNAEEYAASLVANGIVAFDSFFNVRVDYENWCAENGYVALGVGYMRRAVLNAGFERSGRTHAEKWYKLPSILGSDVIPMAFRRPGFFTVDGFEPDVVDDPEPIVPDFNESTEPKNKEGW